jgi:hypothetical protein
MVPVPEALVHDVVQLIYKLNVQGGVAGTLSAWDESGVERYFLAADEDIRSLLSVMARATLAGKTVTDQVVADFMQLGYRETFEVLRRVRESLSSTRSAQLIGIEKREEMLPSGRIRERRVLTMEPDIARMVRAAELAVRALEPHPLDT